MRLVNLTVVILLSSSTVVAASGLPLCVSPVVANSFHDDLLQAKSAGIPMTPEIIMSVASKWQCLTMLRNKDAKPTAFISGQLQIKNGNIQGWTAPDLYIIFINSPKK